MAVTKQLYAVVSLSCLLFICCSPPCNAQYVSTTTMTVQLSFNINPSALPSGFATQVLADIISGLNMTTNSSQSRVSIGAYGNATTSVNGAVAGTSLIFSIAPSTNSSDPSPADYYSALRIQFVQQVGSFFNGVYTSKLNKQYFLVYSTGTVSVASSSTGTNAAIAMESHVGVGALLACALLTWYAVEEWR